MATLAAGNNIEVYAPLEGAITITPGTGGYVDFGCSSPSSDPPDGRRVHSATSINIPAGSTMFMRAVGVDATYTEPATAGGAVNAYTAAQITALATAGGLAPHATYITSDTGIVYRAISASALMPTLAAETTAYVNATASAGATVFTGACEFAGYYCTVAAGNITVYDNTSAAGTIIIPTTALATGPFPIFGAGTNGKLRLGTGCHVVLSGAATVRMLVQ